MVLRRVPLKTADLVPNLYTEEVPETYKAAENPFAPNPASQEEYAEALGAASRSPGLCGGVTDLASRIEACVASKGFVSSPRFVARVVNAWLRATWSSSWVSRDRKDVLLERRC